MAKSKKWIRIKKAKVSRAKNLGLGQLKSFFTSGARKAFIKLKQVFVEAPILNSFNPECYI